MISAHRKQKASAVDPAESAASAAAEFQEVCSEAARLIESSASEKGRVAALIDRAVELIPRAVFEANAGRTAFTWETDDGEARRLRGVAVSRLRTARALLNAEREETYSTDEGRQVLRMPAVDVVSVRQQIAETIRTAASDLTAAQEAADRQARTFEKRLQARLEMVERMSGDATLRRGLEFARATFRDWTAGRIGAPALEAVLRSLETVQRYAFGPDVSIIGERELQQILRYQEATK